MVVAALLAVALHEAWIHYALGLYLAGGQTPTPPLDAAVAWCLSRR